MSPKLYLRKDNYGVSFLLHILWDDKLPKVLCVFSQNSHLKLFEFTSLFLSYAVLGLW